MRVGFFTDTYRPSLNGVVTSIDGFATELRRLDCEVIIVAPRDPRAALSHSDIAVPSGVRVHWLPSMPLIFERNHRLALPLIRRVKRLARLEQLDVVHTHTPFMIGYAGMRASRELGLAAVHTYHTHFAEYSHYLKAVAPVGRRLTPPVSRWLCNLHDLVLAPSTDTRELLHLYGVRTPVEVLMSGVRVPDVPTAQETAAARSQLGLGVDERALLFVGRLAREKNLDLLLEALVRLKRTHPRVRLILVGDGPDRERLVVMARRLGLTEALRFAGRVPHEELRRWFIASDLFVFPSLTETQGLSLLEAMAHALPAVVAAGPGTRDLVDHDRNGLLVPPRPAEVADAIRGLLDHPEQSQRLRHEARRTAESLDMSVQARRLLEHYDLLRRGCARAARRGIRGLAVTAWEQAVAWK